MPRRRRPRRLALPCPGQARCRRRRPPQRRRKSPRRTPVSVCNSLPRVFLAFPDCLPPHRSHHMHRRPGHRGYSGRFQIRRNEPSRPRRQRLRAVHFHRILRSSLPRLGYCLPDHHNHAAGGRLRRGAPRTGDRFGRQRRRRLQPPRITGYLRPRARRRRRRPDAQASDLLQLRRLRRRRGPGRRHPVHGARPSDLTALVRRPQRDVHGGAVRRGPGRAARLRAPDWTPAKISERIIATARDRGRKGWDPEYGHGVIDAAKALA